MNGGLCKNDVLNEFLNRLMSLKLRGICWLSLEAEK